MINDNREQKNIDSSIENQQLLLAQAKSGDISAFQKIFHIYNKRVYGVALNIIGDQHWAEDVTQEVFVRLYRSISKYDTSRKFFTYLYRITVNVCFDHLRREKLRHNKSLDQENRQFSNIIDVSQKSPHEKVEQNELRQTVLRLVQKLGPNQRTAFILRDIEGLESHEIAKILKCRKATVRAHLHFARKLLRQMIETEYPEFCEK